MNLTEMIRMRFLDGTIGVNDIERYVREKMITEEEANGILLLKDKTNADLNTR